MRQIYLDYNASTPVHPKVARAMHAAERGSYGNPSSTHWSGTEAKSILEHSRAQVAALLGCLPQEIVFTSGGSEASNLALKGMYFSNRDRPTHIITSTIEHPSIVEPCRFLERLGARITRLSVDRTGRVDPEDLQRAISPDTILISLMHANNEVGTIQPIEACASIARAHGFDCIQTLLSQLAKSQLRLMSWALACSRLLGTKCMRQRASVLCTSVRACSLSR